MTKADQEEIKEKITAKNSLDGKTWVVNPVSFKVQSVEAYRESPEHSQWSEDFVSVHETKLIAKAFRQKLLHDEIKRVRSELSHLEKMAHPNKATTVERVNVYENLLHRIQMYAEVTLNSKAMKAIISNICSWSYSHRCGNGEFTESEQDKIVNKAFYKLLDIDKK